MKELVFHIGTPKTGSSALQVFLARNRQNFLDRKVDYLPIGEISLGAAGKISSGNGAFLSRTVLPAGAPARIADGERVVRECLEAVQNSNADLGIISSELFVYAEAQALSAIIAELRKMGIVPRCFYFIRSQVQCLASIYMQQVKRHSCTEQPMQYIGRAYKNIHFLRHHSFYREQCALFGASNVLCRTYDAAIETKKGLFHAMLNALSVGADSLDFAIEDVNTSMSTRELSIMLLLNRFHPRMRFSDTVIENAAQFGSAASGQIHNFLPRALVAEMDQFFAKENAKIARQYFHREQLFSAAPLQGEHQDVSVDSLSVADLIAFFGGLLVRYDDRLAALEARLAKQSAAPPKSGAGAVGQNRT